MKVYGLVLCIELIVVLSWNFSTVSPFPQCLLKSLDLTSVEQIQIMDLHKRPKVKVPLIVPEE